MATKRREKARAGGRARRDRILLLIAIFKFLKAALLIAGGLGALELLRPDVARHVHHVVSAITSRGARDALLDGFARVMRVKPGHLRLVGVGAFAYAAVFLTEGTGLWLGKRWAEYFTVIVTGSLIPFEVYEIVRRGTPVKVLALVLNVAVVVYLAVRLRRQLRAER